MADRNFNVSVILGVVDKASAGIQKFNKSIQDNAEMLRTAGLTMTAFGGSIVASLGLAVRAAGQQESQLKKLEQAVNLSGNSWEKSKTKIDAFIDSTQALTKFGDSDLIPSLQKMLVYTKDVDKAMSSVKIAADMASSGMFDLDGATRLVGMAMSGNVEMLGRYIPELKNTNNELLKTMTTSEKADYALGLLKQKFGGMAQAELQTFPALVKQLGNYFGDLTEDIGDKLLPTMKEFTSSALNIIKGLRNWIAEHPILSSVIITVVGTLGSLLVALGGIIAILPTITAGIVALWTVIAAHPIAATIVAITALGAGLFKLADGYIEAQQASYKSGKALQDKIKLLQEERNENTKTLSQAGLLAEERTRLEQRQLLIVKGIKYAELELEKLKNQQILIDNQNRIAEMDALRKQDLETAKRDYENYLAERLELSQFYGEQLIAYENEMMLTISGGFQMAMYEMSNAQTNFYNTFSGMIQSIVSSTSSAFVGLFTNLGQGWSVFSTFVAKIWEGIKAAIIKAIADIIAAETVGYATRKLMSLLFKKTEVANNAAIAASRAAAASAWTLWGAIAIGAAIGAAVIAMAGGFAEGGIVGGNSMVGDNVLARVNSGEMILNRGQQANLFDMINSGGGSGGINIYVSGNQILNDRAAEDLADKIGDVILQRVSNERRI